MADRFKIGDKAWYEVRPGTRTVPRWHINADFDNEDGGESNTWVQTEVIDIKAMWYVVRLPPPTLIEWNFCLGQLVHKVPKNGKAIGGDENICKCDVIALWNAGHSPSCVER